MNSMKRVAVNRGMISISINVTNIQDVLLVLMIIMNEVF